MNNTLTSNSGNYSVFNSISRPQNVNYHLNSYQFGSSENYHPFNVPNYCTISSQPIQSRSNVAYINTVFSNSSSCVFSKLPTFASNDPQKLSNSDPTHSHPKPSNGKISSPPKFYIDPLFRVFDFTSVNSRDVATQHLIKQGLYAQDISPFDGSAHLFAG